MLGSDNGIRRRFVDAANGVIGGGKEIVNIATTVISLPDLPRSPVNSQGTMFDVRPGPQRTGANLVRAVGQRLDLVPDDVDRAAQRDARPLITSLTVPGGAPGAPTVLRLDASVDADFGDAANPSSVVSVYVDGAHAADVVVLGERDAYAVNLGELAPGDHTVDVRAATDQSSGAALPVTITAATPEVTTGVQALAQRHAPIIYGRDMDRPSSIGEQATTDVLLALVPSINENAAGNRVITYTAFYSNEDGGTPLEKLFASSGRTLDIETVYQVEVDGAGNRISATYQGTRHGHHAFAGEYEGDRPVLATVTDNNMFSDRVIDANLRQSLAVDPVQFGRISYLRTVYEHRDMVEIAAKEVVREQKTDLGSGTGQISDPRRYVVLQRDKGGAAIGASLILNTVDGAAREVPIPAMYAQDTKAIVSLPAGMSPSNVTSVDVADGYKAYMLEGDFRVRDVTYVEPVAEPASDDGGGSIIPKFITDLLD